jgi:hypothetical protein
MSFLSSLFAPNKPSQPAAPTFQTDPLVNQTDTELNNFGTNVLQGILPSSYQDLIQTDSPQFQSMLNSSNAQIQGSAMQTAAMNGNARSGAAGAGATQAIASNTANLSYTDLLNTQLNQKSILGAGIGAIQGAQSGALTNQGQENNFAAGVYGTGMQGYNANLNYNANMTDIASKLGSQLGAGIGSGISSLPFLNGSGSGSNPGGLVGQLGSFDSLASTGGAAAGATGTMAGAASFGGTDAIDAILSQGLPLALAA